MAPVTYTTAQLATSQTSGQLPRLWVKLAGEERLALLDSGATHNFLHPELARSFVLCGEPCRVTLASRGTFTYTTGRLDTDLEFRGYASRVTMHVLEGMVEEIILGREWLESNQATLDFARGCVHVGTAQRHTLYWTMTVAPVDPTAPSPVPMEQLPLTAGDEYKALLSEFSDVFTGEIRQPTTRLVTHKIRLTEDKPFKIRRYSYSADKKRIIAEEVTKMLAAGVVRRSHSRYCSPVVIVAKKDGDNRFCVDYR